MVFLFGNKNSIYEKEITEILKNQGADFISDKKVLTRNKNFLIVSRHKPLEIEGQIGIVVFCEKSENYINQKFPCGFIGICEENNKTALEILKNNKLSVISCGMNPKNTVTLSSISENIILISLQRTVKDLYLKDIEPIELKIKLNKNYSPFSVMASAIILLLKGYHPETL